MGPARPEPPPEDLKKRTMPSTTTYKRGHVIVVNVPFSNHTGIKPRPALVISTDAFHRDLPDLIVCPISSQPRYYQGEERDKLL